LTHARIGLFDLHRGLRETEVHDLTFAALEISTFGGDMSRCHDTAEGCLSLSTQSCAYCSPLQI